MSIEWQRCTGEPTLMDDGMFIDGVTPEQHQWVEGPSYQAAGPEGEAPVEWFTLVCERCGEAKAGWRRLSAPVFA